MASLPALRSTAVLIPTRAERARATSTTKVGFLTATVAYLALTYGFFSAASLAASVLTEQARQEGVQALAIARSIRGAEASLAARVEELKGMDRVERWAKGHGFVAPSRLTVSSPYNEDGQARL